MDEIKIGVTVANPKLRPLMTFSAARIENRKNKGLRTFRSTDELKFGNLSTTIEKRQEI